MIPHGELPERISVRAERRDWFSRADAEGIIDWIESNSLRFLGLDVAQKQDDGTWVLMLETLDESCETDNREAVRRGREFLEEFDGDGRMFEPVWTGLR